MLFFCASRTRLCKGHLLICFGIFALTTHRVDAARRAKTSSLIESVTASSYTQSQQARSHLEMTQTLSTSSFQKWKKADVVQVDEKFHGAFHPVLQPDEWSKFAFQKGSSDYLVFTPKRILWVNSKGLTGRKIMYQSIQYGALAFFKVVTSGGFLDRDVELKLYVKGPDTVFIKGSKPTFEKMSFDLAKGADLFGLQSFIAQEANKWGEHTDKRSDVFWQVMEQEFLNLGKGRLTEMDADAIQKSFGHKASNDPDETSTVGGPQFLSDDEEVISAFQRRMKNYAVTNHRVIIKTSSRVSSRVSYKSLPVVYNRGLLPTDFISSWAIESAGLLDLDSELHLRLLDGTAHEIKFRKVDLFGIQELLAKKMLKPTGEKGTSVTQNQSQQQPPHDKQVLKPPAEKGAPAAQNQKQKLKPPHDHKKTKWHKKAKAHGS